MHVELSLIRVCKASGSGKPPFIKAFAIEKRVLSRPPLSNEKPAESADVLDTPLYVMQLLFIYLI